MSLRLLKRLIANRQGVAMIEFAFALPVMLILIIGVVEMGRLLLLEQKLAHVARTMADLVSQEGTLAASDFNNLFSAVRFVAEPFDMSEKGTVIVSSVSVVNSSSPPVMNWQRAGAGSLSASSSIGQPGVDTPNLPANFTVREGYTVIVAEAVFDFSPLFSSSIFPPHRINRIAWFRARRGALTDLEN